MKDKALEKLSKNELLELMLYLRKEYDKLNAENEKLLQKLEDKKSITDRLDRLERQANKYAVLSSAGTVKMINQYCANYQYIYMQ